MFALLTLACAQHISPDEEVNLSARYPAVLAACVQSDGSMDYTALRAERDTVAAYAASLSQGTAPIGEQGLAESINAYNAFVLLGVLDREIEESVQELRVGLFPKGGAGFFVGLRFQYRGQWFSLRAFENEHIREGFRDPRIHAAINCASAGCPPLSAELFASESLGPQLDQAMARFISERNRIENDQAVFSQIFEWFESDFLDWAEADNLCACAARYDVAYIPLAQSGCPHRFEPYDWSLNQAE